MIDIFKCLGVPPDVGADEILQLLRDSKSESKWDVKYHDAIALLTAIEQRGERKVWKQMAGSCKHLTNQPTWSCSNPFYCMHGSENVNDWDNCQFDTCPLLLAGEGEGEGSE